MNSDDDAFSATPPRDPRRSGGWNPPRWVLALLAFVSIASGAFRLVLGSSLFDRAFGVLLIVLGVSWVRDFRRSRDASATDGAAG